MPSEYAFTLRSILVPSLTISLLHRYVLRSHYHSFVRNMLNFHSRSKRIKFRCLNYRSIFATVFRIAVSQIDHQSILHLLSYGSYQPSFSLKSFFQHRLVRVNRQPRLFHFKTNILYKCL